MPLSCYYGITCIDGRGGQMFPGGQNLRVLREQLGLTMRDVENASARIAQKRANDEFAIPQSRLSDVETKGVIPSIYRLYSFFFNYPAATEIFPLSLHDAFPISPRGPTR